SMLTNFFGKSNPINFIVCGVLLLFTLFAAMYGAYQNEMASVALLRMIGMFLLLLFALLLLDFVIRKNALTQINTYAIVLFTCLIAMLPVIYTEREIITSTVFILLALRRIASLPSERNIEKKLFDASLYIAIATVFHFWSILYFFPLYWAISKVQTQSFRYFFIPILGVVTVGICTVTYLLLFQDSLAWFIDLIPPLRIDFSAYNALNILLPSALIATLIIWIITVRLLRVASLQRKVQRNYRLITIFLITSIAVTLLSPVKSGAEMLFVIPPLAIVSTNYIERTSDFWFKESLLWLLLILPGVIFVFFGI
ncbi:MAG: DUF6427 family protein, partial [Marinirhabdus sp.]|nr:DUF6427 family protein [Marinirhabdus sp.]